MKSSRRAYSQADSLPIAKLTLQLATTIETPHMQPFSQSNSSRLGSHEGILSPRKNLIPRPSLGFQHTRKWNIGSPQVILRERKRQKQIEVVLNRNIDFNYLQLLRHNNTERRSNQPRVPIAKPTFVYSSIDQNQSKETSQEGATSSKKLSSVLQQINSQSSSLMESLEHLSLLKHQQLFVTAARPSGRKILPRKSKIDSRNLALSMESPATRVKTLELVARGIVEQHLTGCCNLANSVELVKRQGHLLNAFEANRHHLKAHNRIQTFLY